MASADYYLKIDTIEGEAEAVGFEKQMQIESFSFGSTNSGSSGVGTGAGTGKAQLHDFHFVVEYGKASLPLFLASVKGNHIPHAILSLRKTGGDGTPYTYLTVTFEDLVISSYSTGGSNGSGSLPMDSIAFNFTKISKVYSQQKADGTVSKTNSVAYDVKKVQGSGA